MPIPGLCLTDQTLGQNRRHYTLHSATVYRSSIKFYRSSPCHQLSLTLHCFPITILVSWTGWKSTLFSHPKPLFVGQPHSLAIKWLTYYARLRLLETSSKTVLRREKIRTVFILRIAWHTHSSINTSAREGKHSSPFLEGALQFLRRLVTNHIDNTRSPWWFMTTDSPFSFQDHLSQSLWLADHDSHEQDGFNIDEEMSQIIIHHQIWSGKKKAEKK